jgi:lipoate-protein ligase A
VKPLNPKHWRFILSPPTTGVENMALDEAILMSVTAGESPPTLRLYAWEPPCLSIGYAQPVADVDQKALDTNGWDLVRRPTGGRAILHTDELTYAIVATSTDQHVGGGVLESYQRISRGLVASLTLLGLSVEVQPDLSVPEVQRSNPVCFQVPSAYEITVNGRKLIGSAQVRRRDGVLQHGSLPLRGDISRICQVLHFEDEASQSQAVHFLQDRAATVEELLGSSITWQQVADAVIQGFREALDLDLELDSPSDSEIIQAKRLASSCYTDPGWTERV